MKLKGTLITILIVGVSFSVYYILFLNFKFFKTELDKLTNQGLVSYIVTYLAIGFPIFIATYFLNKGTNILKSLGLAGNMLTGIWTSALFTLPMFAGGLLFFDFNKQIEIQNLIAGTLVAGFMEELYFRGFLYGQIFRNSKLGFIPAVFAGALIFAIGHIWQGQNISEASGIFLITFAGAVFFAWLFTEWDYNLWVAIFLHTFMNLAWSIFQFNETALGDMQANVFRGLTIATAIIFTVFYKKSKKQKLVINRKTLIMNTKND